MITEVAPGVFSVEHQVVAGKNGIIIGTRTGLAIDAGNYPEEGQAMADFIEVQGLPANRLVFTHGHADHILGSGAFRGAEVMAHALTPAVMRRTLPLAADRSGVPVAQLEAQIAWPTTTFTDELWIDLGGKRVRLFPTPGHSKDGISVYVKEDNLLFGGDTVFSGIVPAIGDGDSRELEATLHTLAEMEIATLVPGHGTILWGAENTRECLTWAATYLALVRAFVREELARGRDASAVGESATYERFVGDRIAPGRHGMVKRHHGVVEKIVQEEMLRERTAG